MNFFNNAPLREYRKQLLPFFLLCAILLFTGCGSEMDNGPCGKAPRPTPPPIVLLSGTSSSTIVLETGKTPAVAEQFFLSNGSIEIPLNPTQYKGCCRTEFSTGMIPAQTCSYDFICKDSTTGHAQLIKKDAVKVIGQFHIALTFDDGPAIGGAPNDGDIQDSPTIQVLDFLDRFRHGPDNSNTGIKAAFFVLTSPDHFLHDVYYKAECADGKAVLKETAARGHVIGCHWGGEYYGQTRLHCRRAMLPPYDSLGTGCAQGENALESDLLECIRTIRQVTGTDPEFVRPTLWRYCDPKIPGSREATLATYQRLGLKMVLSDAKYPDGGYAIISLLNPFEMSNFRQLLRRAFSSGQDRLILSMHDSNAHTAKRMEQIFTIITEEFEKMRFGGNCDKAGNRLVYAQSAEEVKTILRSKTRFVMFPYYCEGTSQGQSE